ncbi:IS66 family insertion sequence element accessory protein TnpA [Dysgonomonas sp. GY75]|uniref:IS66 family insertion sequence element accessory protein TnpA n=1 Tax=Dysgonomonas sp. GY75 TaxID=2780419 RepID=UPI0039774FD0
MRSKKWTIEVFEALYNRYLESGLPPKAFCANEGIHLDRFYEWRVKLSLPKSNISDKCVLFRKLIGLTFVIKQVYRTERLCTGCGP